MLDIWYHNGTTTVALTPGQVSGFENAKGDGEVHCYRLFDGVHIMRMQLDMERYTEVRSQKGMLEVNFCVNGRFETGFSLRDHVLLKPGDRKSVV